MSLRKVDTYIALEILVPSVIGLGIFTFILISGRALKLADLVISKGVPVIEIGQTLLYLLPSFMVFTLPLSFLLGVLLGLGRMSADSETVALRASGVSLYGILKPVTILAGGATLMTAFLTLYLLPPSQKAFRDHLFDMAQTKVAIGIEPGVFNSDYQGLTLLADKVEPESGVLNQVFISDQRNPQRSSVITARNGQILSDAFTRQLVLRLKQGAIYRLGAQNQDQFQVVRFTHYDIQLHNGQSTAAQKRYQKTKELPLVELLRRFQNTNDPQFMAEWHKRFALPFCPLVMAFVGIPLALRQQRSGKGAGYTVALLTFLMYYLLLSLGMTMAESGRIPPALALWSPNGIFLAAGIFLFRRAAEEQVLFPVPLWLSRLTDKIHLRRRKNS